MRKGRVTVSVLQKGLLADVVLAGIAHQRSRQQPRLAQDLKAVADAHHQAAIFRELRDRLHHRRKLRDGARPQIVAIGESARYEDGVAALKVLRGMPQIGHRLMRNRIDHVVGVMVAIGPGKDQNAEFHT